MSEKQGDLRPKMIQIGKGDGSPGSGVFMLGTPPGTCAECAVAHKPEEMHDNRSLPYQYQFANKHGRWPTWEDAIAHCSPEYKEVAMQFLREQGLWTENEKPGTVVSKEERTADILMGVKKQSTKQIMEPGNIAPVTTVKIPHRKRKKKMGEGLQRAAGAAMQSRLPVKVKVGQVWEDNDPRITYKRQLKVIAIKGTRAQVQGATKTWIRLDRFRPTKTGYRLVKDV